MRRALAFLMMLWLALQGFAAVAMPFCPHAMHIAAGPASAASPRTHHMHDGHPLHQPLLTPDHRSHDVGFDCKDCGVCHLACAPAAVSDAPAVHFHATHFYGGRIRGFAPLFIPEQPHPPPAVPA